MSEISTITEPDDVITVLGNSLYPGAKRESIEMVLSYCRTNGLDPFLRPVHIVPTSIKVSSNPDKWETRDVLMPGIADYRIKAARSGEYAGKSEPEFGPDITGELGGVSLTYPAWCRVVVTRIVQGQAREFVANERWLENYATASHNTPRPNRMWLKRPYGQLAKCAEAQALRMAFPEFSGGQPTAEEMEGKTGVFDGPTIEHQAPARQSLPPPPARAPAQPQRSNGQATPPAPRADQWAPLNPDGGVSLDPLDQDLGFEWLQALALACRDARTKQEVERIGAHPKTGEAIASAPDKQRQQIAELLADAYSRVAVNEAAPPTESAA